MTVHAAIRQQTEDMHGLARADGFIHGVGDGGIAEELAVTDRLGYPGEVLIHHTAGTEVHMADLGVAHLPVRQAHIHAGAGDQAVRLGGEQVVVNRGVGRINGVVLGIVAVTEAIQDDQHQGFWRGRHKYDPCSGEVKVAGHFNPGCCSSHRPAGFGRPWGLCILAAILSVLEFIDACSSA